MARRQLGVAASAATHLLTRADGDARYPLSSLYTAKGSLLAATAASTPTNVAVGANGTVLVADSTAAAGVAWSTASPRGVLGLHTLTTTFTTVATHTTMQAEGLTIAVTEVAGRKLAITLIVNPYVPGGVNTVRYRLLRAGATVREWDIPQEALSTGFSHGITLNHIVASATGGAATWSVTFGSVVNNTSSASFGSTGNHRQLLVEDIGA